MKKVWYSLLIIITLVLLGIVSFYIGEYIVKYKNIGNRKISSNGTC